MVKHAHPLSPFLWHGTTKQGETVSGVMSAANAAIVRAQLQRQHIHPQRVKKLRPSWLSLRNKINSADIVILTRQLATLLNAGLTLVASLESIAKSMQKPTLQLMLVDIKTQVEQGRLFSEALAQYPKQFNSVFCSLIHAAENAGALDRMLLRIADDLENSQVLKNKVKKALTYPCVIFAITVLIATCLLLFVVPQFEQLFAAYGATLPSYTQAIIAFSTLLKTYGFSLVAGISLVGVCVYKVTQKSPWLQNILDRATLKLPIVGRLIEHATVARICRTLATNLCAGMPLTQALSIASRVANHSVYRDALNHITRAIHSGQRLNTAMQTTQRFPSLVLQMIAAGEDAGALETMLNKVADFYEDDVDTKINQLSQFIEPLTMVLLGTFIGGFVLAMYLPIFRLGSIF